MCKKNLKKQNVVEELSWGGGISEERKKALKRPTQREKIKKKVGGTFRRRRKKSTKTPNTERENKEERGGLSEKKKH